MNEPHVNEASPHETAERTYQDEGPRQPENIAKLSGLALLEQLQAGTLPRPSLGHTLDFSLREVTHGRAVFESRPQDFALNPMGTLHGGFYCSLLDSALGCAVHSTLGPGERYTTVQIDVTFVRPMRPGDEAVEAVGEMVHRGRRTASARGELRGVESGRLYAHGTTNCFLMPAKQS